MAPLYGWRQPSHAEVSCSQNALGPSGVLSTQFPFSVPILGRAKVIPCLLCFLAG
jgi:hypothetical protein